MFVTLKSGTYLPRQLEPPPLQADIVINNLCGIRLRAEPRDGKKLVYESVDGADEVRIGQNALSLGRATEAGFDLAACDIGMR